MVVSLLVESRSSNEFSPLCEGLISIVFLERQNKKRKHSIFFQHLREIFSSYQREILSKEICITRFASKKERKKRHCLLFPSISKSFLDHQCKKNNQCQSNAHAEEEEEEEGEKKDRAKQLSVYTSICSSLKTKYNNLPFSCFRRSIALSSIFEPI